MILYDRGTKTRIPATPWSEEGDLDRFLLEHPDLLGLLLDADGERDDAARSVIPLAGNAVGGQLARIDALFVHWDASGQPWLIVCEDKRHTNGELKSRAALGQVLDYAATLASLNQPEFAARLARNIETPAWQSNFAALRARLGIQRNQGAVVSAAVEAHREQRFLLLVCANFFPRPFVTTLRWLNERLQNGPRFEAIDVTPSELRDQQRSLVSAVALATMMKGRSAEAVATRATLDDELRSIVDLIIHGQVVASFAELEVHDSLIAARLDAGTVSNMKDVSGTSPKTKLTVHAWAQKATPAMRALYEALSAALPEAKWRGGEGLLMLDLPGKAGGVDVMRLGGDRAYLLGKHRLSQVEGGSDSLAWWHNRVTALGASSLDKPQPVVLPDNIGALSTVRLEDLVAFLKELLERRQDA